MNNEIKLGDIVVFNIGDKTFDIIGKYIVSDDRLWRVDAITENDPPTPDRDRKYRLVAVDCPNVMLDEIPEIYIESYSEKLERELEEQRKEALKMNRNEIKQGDKVRVSKDIPQFYLEYNSYRMFEIEHRVVDVNMEDGFALLDSIPPKFTTILPCKYLVKVDAETKEPKFKVGDVVRIKPTADKLHQGYQNGYAWLPERDEYLGRVASVKEIWCDGSIILSIRNNMLWEPIDLEPYTEPTEQTVAEKKPNVGSIKIPVEVDLTDSYWDAYAADLAKEIVLKTVNSASDKRPSVIAEYATDVAKAVVEGLKRK